MSKERPTSELSQKQAERKLRALRGDTLGSGIRSTARKIKSLTSNRMFLPKSLLDSSGDENPFLDSDSFGVEQIAEELGQHLGGVRLVEAFTQKTIHETEEELARAEAELKALDLIINKQEVEVQKARELEASLQSADSSAVKDKAEKILESLRDRKTKLVDAIAIKKEAHEHKKEELEGIENEINERFDIRVAEIEAQENYKFNVSERNRLVAEIASTKPTLADSEKTLVSLRDKQLLLQQAKKWFGRVGGYSEVLKELPNEATMPDDVRARLAQARADLEVHRDNSDVLKNVITENESLIASLEDKIKALSSQLGKMEKSRDKFNTAIIGTEARIRAVETKRGELGLVSKNSLEGIAPFIDEAEFDSRLSNLEASLANDPVSKYLAVNDYLPSELIARCKANGFDSIKGEEKVDFVARLKERNKSISGDMKEINSFLREVRKTIESGASLAPNYLEKLKQTQTGYEATYDLLNNHIIDTNNEGVLKERVLKEFPDLRQTERNNSSIEDPGNRIEELFGFLNDALEIGNNQPNIEKIVDAVLGSIKELTDIREIARRYSSLSKSLATAHGGATGPYQNDTFINNLIDQTILAHKYETLKEKFNSPSLSSEEKIRCIADIKGEILDYHVPTDKRNLEQYLFDSSLSLLFDVAIEECKGDATERGNLAKILDTVDGIRKWLKRTSESANVDKVTELCRVIFDAFPTQTQNVNPKLVIEGQAALRVSETLDESDRDTRIEGIKKIMEPLSVHGQVRLVYGILYDSRVPDKDKAEYVSLINYPDISNKNMESSEVHDLLDTIHNMCDMVNAYPRCKGRVGVQIKRIAVGFSENPNLSPEARIHILKKLTNIPEINADNGIIEPLFKFYLDVIKTAGQGENSSGEIDALVRQLLTFKESELRNQYIVYAMGFKIKDVISIADIEKIDTELSSFNLTSSEKIGRNIEYLKKEVLNALIAKAEASKKLDSLFDIAQYMKDSGLENLKGVHIFESIKGQLENETDINVITDAIKRVKNVTSNNVIINAVAIRGLTAVDKMKIEDVALYISTLNSEIGNGRIIDTFVKLKTDTIEGALRMVRIMEKVTSMTNEDYSRLEKILFSEAGRNSSDIQYGILKILINGGKTKELDLYYNESGLSQRVYKNTYVQLKKLAAEMGAAIAKPLVASYADKVALNIIKSTVGEDVDTLEGIFTFIKENAPIGFDPSGLITARVAELIGAKDNKEYTREMADLLIDMGYEDEGLDILNSIDNEDAEVDDEFLIRNTNEYVNNEYAPINESDFNKDKIREYVRQGRAEDAKGRRKNKKSLQSKGLLSRIWGRLFNRE